MNIVIKRSGLAVVLSLVTVAALLIMPFYSYAASTIYVTGNTSAGENQPGWLFNRDATTATPYSFTTSKASIGSGSLYVAPIGATPSNKFIAELFSNVAIADVNSFSYDFLIGAGSTAADANEFYLNVYANFGSSPDNKFYDCRYGVVATTGSTGSWTTVTFDPDQAYSVATRGGTNASPYPCPASPAAMDSLNPGSTIRAFSLNVGDTSASDVGVSGYLDNVVTNFTSGITIYDFELQVPLKTKDQCTDGGWSDYGFKNHGQCVRFIETGKDSR